MKRAIAALCLLSAVTLPAAAEMTRQDISALMELSPGEIRTLIDAGLDPNLYAGGDPLLTRLIPEIGDDADLERIEILLDAGADVNAPGQFAQTPFLYLLMFGTTSDEMARRTIRLFLDHGAQLGFVSDVDLDGDGIPEMEGQLGLGSVFAAPNTLEATGRLLAALELGARFDGAAQATFATPFFYAATADDDGTLAAAFLEAGARPCFFPAEHAEKPVRMLDGVTRPQSAVWEIQWQGALDWGLQDRLSGQPDVLAALKATRGVCPPADGAEGETPARQ